MAKKILKHFCIYNTKTREIMNVRTVDVLTKVSEELGDWFDIYPKDESEPLLWEYERSRYEKGAQGLGSAHGQGREQRQSGQARQEPPLTTESMERLGQEPLPVESFWV